MRLVLTGGWLGGLVGEETFDVFISYGHEDAAWVHTLAENLHRLGLDVFLDKWEIAPGDVVVHELERGLLNSRNGVLVVSPASVARPWVQQEYAVMVSRAVEGRQRLIPVLLGDVDVPPFAATRLWVDFRGADGPEYDRRVCELAAALRGERPQRPSRGGELVGPPGSRFRPEGPRRATLRIKPEQTVLEVDGEEEAAGRPAGPSHQLEEQLWQLQRARQLGPQTATVPLKTAGEPDAVVATTHGRLVAVGTGLAEAFLPGPVRTALAEQVRLAVDQGAALQLAVEVAGDGLSDLPWEALVLPELDGGPLVLHSRVGLYRAVGGLGVAPAIQIPGPLRILVVIGSPDQGARGELLDYEAELQRILDAVDAARRDNRAYVRVLNRGTVPELRAALEAQRFHVLHLSCHARPGGLVLEDDQGRPDLVTAERLAAEVLVADRGVPLMMLAGCSTALSERLAQQPAGDPGSTEQGEAALPGLARQLLAHGVPAVLAMNAPVSDPYATRLGARLYQLLATQQRPDPLAAVSDARRQVDAELRRAPAGSREARLAELAEWATPTLAVRGSSLPLFDPDAAFEHIDAPPEPRLAAGIVVRGVGDFVGRRTEQRLLLAGLRGSHAGVVIHGIGGVGKSTLAAQLVADLGDQAGLVVSVAGKVTVDQILDETGRRLHSACLARRLDEGHPWRQLARLLREPNLDWDDRLDLLGEHVLGQLPVLLLVDNFEDNLHPAGDATGGFELVDPQLAGFLAAWVQARGMGRLLVTSRHRFPLPDQAERRLVAHHLGPLSLAETRKLVWRLPGLDRLPPRELQRAYADVGGHPRALEYLEGLLRGGHARFADVADRLERALAERDVDDPAGWLAGVEGDLDRALAETITLAVNDVLLDDLVGRLDSVPLARRLLLGVSVYQRPVDTHGVAWQVAEESTQPTDPQRHQRLQQFAAAIHTAQTAGQQLTPETLGVSEAEFAELARGLARGPRPPLAVPDGLREALAAVVDLGLVVPTLLEGSADAPAEPEWVVHRWTAAALARLAATPDIVEAHRRAARYWRWRVQVWPQGRQADIADLLEARHHHLATGDLDNAVEVTEWVCTQLNTWGAWSWEEQLCQETIQLVPERSRHAAVFTHQLGQIAQQRGDYERALEWFRQALTILEEVGDRAAMAGAYHHLGIVTQERGDYERALDWYRQALAIDEEVGNWAAMARSYHQLGIVAQQQGAYEQALDWYRQALATFEQVGYRAGMAGSYLQLGNAAYLRGDYERALDWYRQALAIDEELGDRAGMADVYHQLGMVAHQRWDYERALGYYRQALTIREELGDRPGMAGAYHQLGSVAQEREDYERALDWYRQALAIFEEVGNRAGKARSYHQLGIVAQEQGDYERALDWYRQALAIFEEVGDRANMADSYHQLGNVAYLRGDHERAFDWYRQALAIDEELGNRAGMADTASQIGILLTETGNPQDGMTWNLRSLRIRVALQLPQGSINLRWLARQQVLLGQQLFQQRLREELGDRDSQTVLEWLRQLPDAR